MQINNHELPRNKFKTGDSPSLLRTKFTLLFMGGQASLGVIQWAGHIYQLLSDISHPQRLAIFAKKMAEREVAEIQFNTGKKTNLNTKIAYYVITELVKDLARVILFPIFLSLRQFIALYGIINPLHGRVLYGNLEQKFSRMYRSTEFDNSKWNVFTHYSAPCLQQYPTWVRENLFRYMHGYDQRSGQAGLNRLYREMQVLANWDIEEHPLKKLGENFSNLQHCLKPSQDLGHQKKRTELVDKMTRAEGLVGSAVSLALQNQSAHEKLKELNQLLDDMASLARKVE